MTPAEIAAKFSPETLDIFLSLVTERKNAPSAKNENDPTPKNTHR